MRVSIVVMNDDGQTLHGEVDLALASNRSLFPREWQRRRKKRTLPSPSIFRARCGPS
jgi:hypothetical protein